MVLAEVGEGSAIDSNDYVGLEEGGLGLFELFDVFVFGASHVKDIFLYFFYNRNDFFRFKQV